MMREVNSELNYDSYLNIPDLLLLQKPVTEYHREELIFIVTHQAMELWFKVLLLEIDLLITFFFENFDYLVIIKKLDDCRSIWKVMIAQFEGIKALTPLDFMMFRRGLQQASGAQSSQYILLEKKLGTHIFCTEKSNNLHDIVLTYLANKHRRPDLLYNERWLVDLYRTDNHFSLLINKLLEFDELFIEWKHNHVNLVRRMIGKKIGTASTYASDLNKKSEILIFPELWDIKDYL